MKQTALRKVRRQLRIKQVELANRLRLKKNTVCQAEQYGIKKRSTAERYAAALGCDWKDLLD